MWKAIPDFPEYEVNELGQVYSHKSNKVLSPYDNGRGYLKVCLCRNGKVHKKMIHRLVAEAFIPNPDDLPQVNHKDENIINNHVSNLEWCDAKYNCNYGTRNERLSKPVAAYTKAGKLVATYESIKAAAKAVERTPVNVCNCLRGRSKTCAGLVWKYADVS